MKQNIEVCMCSEKIRVKAVENRKQMGMKQCDVVCQLQLYGLDITENMYGKFERGIRSISAVEFLFLTKILNIDTAAMMSAV